MAYTGPFADYHLHAYAPIENAEKCFQHMADLNVTDVNMLAYTYIETTMDNNLLSLYYQEKFKSVRLRTFGGLYYEPDLNNKIMPYKEQAELLLAMGCEGIKFLDMKPNYNLYCGCNMDDDVYDAMYDMLEERGIPLDTHIGDPATFWHKDQMLAGEIARGWCYEDPKFLTQQQIFDCTLRRLEKNPNLKMCLAHFGFMSQRPELCYEIFERFPNVTLDLTPAWNIFVDFGKDVPTWQEFFTKYSDRILYGTDTSTNSSPEHIAALQRTMIEIVSHDTTELPIPHFPYAKMRGLDLSEEAQRNILHDNYFRRVGETRKEVDWELWKEHARLIEGIAKKNGNQEILKNLETMKTNPVA